MNIDLDYCRGWVQEKNAFESVVEYKLYGSCLMAFTIKNFFTQAVLVLT